MSIAKSTDGKQSFLKDLTSKSPIHQIIFPLIFIADSSRFYLRKVEKEEKEAETYDQHLTSYDFVLTTDHFPVPLLYTALGLTVNL